MLQEQRQLSIRHLAIEGRAFGFGIRPRFPPLFNYSCFNAICVEIGITTMTKSNLNIMWYL